MTPLRQNLALSVCMSVTFVSPAETAEPIEMSFGWVSRVGQKDWVQIPQEIDNFGVFQPVTEHRESLLVMKKR